MTPVLLYLLKANLVLLLFAAAYFGLLRRLTFFSLNRFYLVLALLFAAAYPALPVPALLPSLVGPAADFVMAETVGANAGVATQPVGPPVDWAAVGLAVYAAGAAVGLARLLVQLLSLWGLRQTAPRTVVHGQRVRVLTGAVSPFSFWQTIYLNPTQHPASELTAVLRHEQVHVCQWHTLDVLLAHVAVAAAWCNPAAWLLRRALLDNLEFLADRAALQTGIDRQAYQYSLLRLSQGATGPALVSHFTFFTLKNRVAMMNTPFSSPGQLARYVVAGPLVLAAALAFSAVRAQGAGVAPAPSQRATAGGPTTYYIDGKLSDKAAADNLDPKSIAFVNVLDEEKARKIFGAQSGSVLIVVTSQNQNSPEVLALNEKVARVAPWVLGTEAPAEVNVLTPTALAYITKTYPNSRIIGVTKLSYPSTGQVRYKVQLAEGRRPHYAFFDEQGNPSKL